MSNNEAAEPVFDSVEPMGNHPNELSRLTAETLKLTQFLAEAVRNRARRVEEIKQLMAETKQTMAKGNEVHAYIAQLFAVIVKLNRQKIGRELTEVEKKELWEGIIEGR